jgi:asparagine synthase (glutamine-hydrolysing)
MPGIVGVVSSEKRESLDTCIENMILAMRPKNWHRVEKKITSDMGIASISLEDEKSIAEENSILVAVTGEICDQEKLRGKLLDLGDENASRYSLSDILLRLYLKLGAGALCNLNGLYVICVWEDKSQKLTIVTDRYGFRKLYYWLAKDRLLFASEYKSIFWHPKFNKKISEVSLSDFLSVSYLLDDRTPFEDIKLVPPASVMTYQRGVLSLSRYWDYEFYTTGSKILSEDHYIDEYARRLQEAVRKRAKENMCLQVTGGLDSRCLAGILNQCAQGLKVKTSTIGHAHCYDVEFGREIAGSLGYEHTFIPVGPSYITEYSNECVWRLEGTVSCFTSWIFALNAFLEENGIRFVMNGFLGDCLSGGHLPRKLLKETNAEHAVKYLYKYYYNTPFKDDELARFLKPNIYENIKGESFNSIKRCFDTANTDNILSKVDYVDLHQRQRRFIAAHIDVSVEFSRVLDPFADNDFVDFILRVPVEMRVGQRIYKKMIVNHLPEVAKIPHTVTGMPLDASSFRIKLQDISHRLQKRFYNKILPRITFRKWGNHDFRASFHFNEWLRTGSKDFVIGILNQREYLEDYFNMDVINELVTDHMEGRRDDWGKICALVTFSLWRRQFCQ